MNEWISVKDRMPEEGVDVLVYGEICHNKKGIEVDFVKNGDFVACDEEVTHWMPLPELPAHDREPPVSDDMRDHLRAYIAGAEDY